jgi:hypothetical protein
MRWPSLSSSPWILTYPQRGFSLAFAPPTRQGHRRSVVVRSEVTARQALDDRADTAERAEVARWHTDDMEAEHSTADDYADA